MHDLDLGTVDITVPGFYLRPDFHELCAQLRAHSPVHAMGDGTWLVTRYDDIRAISRQPELFSSRHGAIVNDPLRGREPNDAAGSILHLDPPRHADYRKLLNRRFTPRAVGTMGDQVRAATVAALDALPGAVDADGVVDAVPHLCAAVPVKVIADLLGVGDHDLADFRRWSDAIIEVTDHPDDPEVLAATVELFTFLDALVTERRSHPGEDLVSALAGATVGDEPLTQSQLVMFCLTLLVAGNETTRSLLSGGLLALAEHPDQRAALTADPDLLPGAVEELLRWVTPIQAFCRTAVEDTEIAGTAVPAGAYLVMLYGSGNRDESVFGPTADRLDVRRPVSPTHVAFGFGEHLCLGAALARLEAQIVLEHLLRRHPAYEVAATPTEVPSTLTRSLATLPIRLAPR